jgi:hypothetical protein
VDQHKAVITRLRERHGEKVAEEKTVADNEMFAEGERAVARCQQLVTEYQPLAEKIGVILEEIEACQAAIVATNDKLERAGDKRRVLKPGMVPRGPQQRIDLPRAVNLPGASGEGKRVWPPHDTAAMVASQARGRELLLKATAQLTGTTGALYRGNGDREAPGRILTRLLDGFTPAPNFENGVHDETLCRFTGR